MIKESRQDYINKEQKETNARQDDINTNVAKHLEIANTEMGVVKNDLAWVKDKVRSIDTKLWGIITGLVIAVLAEMVRLLK